MKLRNLALAVLGLWILISPWLLGFFDVNAALYSNVIAGVLILIVVMWHGISRQ